VSEPYCVEYARAFLGWANFHDWRAAVVTFRVVTPVVYLAWRRGGFFERRYRRLVEGRLRV
jgi:hypothetical protein